MASLSSAGLARSPSTRLNPPKIRTFASALSSPTRLELPAPLSRLELCPAHWTENFVSNSRPAQRLVTASRARASMSASVDAGYGSQGEKKIGVLFVCLGNICRSPTAEAVFRDVVEKQGLGDKFNIDSAGTIDYHEGNPADPRMRKSAANRGIKITSISRPIRASDFTEFDYILAMDKQNSSDIQKAFMQWSKNMHMPADGLSKVKLMCSHCKKFGLQEVPDPYYGGPEGFETVLDLLDDACTNLLDSLKEKITV